MRPNQRYVKQTAMPRPPTPATRDELEQAAQACEAYARALRGLADYPAGTPAAATTEGFAARRAVVLTGSALFAAIEGLKGKLQ